MFLIILIVLIMFFYYVYVLPLSFLAIRTILTSVRTATIREKYIRD